MVRRPTAAACLLTACAMFALLSTSALATPGSLEFGKCAKTAGGKFKNAGCTKLAKTAEEQKFEWTSLSKVIKFTSAKKAETGEAVLEAANENKISCKNQVEKEGEYGPGSKEQKNIVLELTGCESLGADCTSAGQPGGHINTNKLDGAPGVIQRAAKEEKNLDGVDFKGQASEVFAEFSCGPVPYVLRGSVIVKAGSIVSGKFKSSTNKMLNKQTLDFAEAPEKFEGEPKDVLEASVGGGTFQEGSLSLISVEQTNPKTTKIELRQCEKDVC